MNSTNNAPKELKCKWGDNFAASRGEDEKKLVSLDVRKLDTLSLLHTNTLQVKWMISSPLSMQAALWLTKNGFC